MPDLTELGSENEELQHRRDMAEFCSLSGADLTEWERNFLDDILENHLVKSVDISEAQNQKLLEINEKVEKYYSGDE